MLMAWLRLDISIHALRKESDRMVRPIRLITPISIHALRKESDRLVNILVISDTISIHALRKESDSAGGEGTR